MRSVGRSDLKVSVLGLGCNNFGGRLARGAPVPEGSRLAKTKPLADMFMTDRNFELAERYRTFAAARGHSLLDLSISWLLARKPVASVIAGASSPEQLEANAMAVGWALSSEDLAEIDHLAEASNSS